MINANKEKIASFFQGTLEYEIPFFQRAYVWSEENWTIFWEHLIAELDAYENGVDSEHFIGTIITKEKQSKNLGENIVELIDGQQRLTTISVFFKAMADTVNGELPNLKNSLYNLLWFEDNHGAKHYRMSHSRIDKPNFEKIMDRPDSITKEDTSAIIKAYGYFKDNLSGLTDTKREKLMQVLLYKIPVISMLLDKDDDEQEIFDTINSLGVRLTIGELLKNYIFKEKELQKLYEEYWHEVFENDEQQVKYWLTERTSGRVRRDNMEMLLYCFLINETKREIRLERLFKEYKTYLKEMSNDDKIAFLKRLKSLATIYMKLPQATELVEIRFNEEEKRFFHVLENLEITTIYPLVLYLYQKVNDKVELIRILGILESYLVLRQICKLTTKNYNNLFLQIIRALEKSPEEGEKEHTYSERLASIINGFVDESNKKPSANDVKKAFQEQVLSNKQAGEILYIIALKDIASDYSDNKSLSSKSFSVEHIMPKKWQENWNDDSFSELDVFRRNQKLKTLGNLTLITKNLNSKLRNQSWADKKETLEEYSSLRMTTAFLEKEDWDEETIIERAEHLAEKALGIWT